MGVAKPGGMGSGGGKIPKEDDEEATGEPEDIGETGPTYIDPNTGAVTPEFDPAFARDPATGELYGSDTAQWDQPGVSNWNLPQSYEQTPNVAPNWTAPGLDVGNTPWPDAPAAETPVSGDSGGQNFQQYASRGDIASDATYSPYGGQDFSSYQGADESGFTNAYGGQDFSQYDGAGDDFSQGSYGGGYDEDTGDTGYDDSSYDDSSYDASQDFSGADYGGGYDEDTGDTGYDDSGYSGSDYDYSGADYGGGYDDYSDYGGGESYDDSGYSGGDYDYSGGDYGGGYESYDYARGGQVRQPPARGGVMPTTGGAVPRSASPSKGRQTDDISARLNAGEYVIPRDVVKHQGTKFFTDLIAKSRKLRTGMTGAAPKPTMKSALPAGRPTFQSRPLPPR
jgi:hypothetical protein